MNGLAMPIVVSYLSLPHELTHVCFPEPSPQRQASPGRVVSISIPQSLLPSVACGEQSSGCDRDKAMGQSWPCQSASPC